MKNLTDLSHTEILNTPASILKDYLLCLVTNVPTHQWAEDLKDEPDAYDYTIDELETFIYLLNN